ncbi:MAG: hypothetical protein KDA20_05105 [Phycisphaerales bacterium]|nr:hypothetical protein [Phycisphaerales bacterium]
MKYLAVTASLVACALAPNTRAGTPTFQVIELEGAGLDIPTQVSANYVAGQLGSDPVVWDLQTGLLLNNLSGLVGTQGSIFLAINDSGAVTGNVANNAFVWSQANGLTMLPTGFHPSDINNNDVIVGYYNTHPSRWDATNGVQELNLIQGYTNTINDNDVVGGQSSGLAAIWVGGVESLVPFDIPPGFSFVADINDNGIAVGKYAGTIAYQWDINTTVDATPISLPSYLGNGLPRGLNNDGLIIASGTDPGTSDPSAALFVPTEGWIALNNVLPGAPIVDITPPNEEGWFGYFTFSGGYLARRADPCPNLDGTGTVDLNDLSIVLFNFGNTGLPGIPGDANLDGVVDLADLSAVLFAFGTSPC